MRFTPIDREWRLQERDRPGPVITAQTVREADMNADLIETREQAFDLLDAEMITFGMYVASCRFKGWQT